MKIVGIHQGHFLPWLGYWNKMASAEVFIWLNTVQFRKNYFQNRTHIKARNGRQIWCTVPVTFAHGDPISSVRICDRKWKKKVLETIRHCYGKAPFFSTYFPAVDEVIRDSPDMLDDLNYALVTRICELLDFHTVIRKSSEFEAGDDPTERLVDLCKAVGASHYIVGKGGHRYLRVELFDHAGIRIVWQQFHENQPGYPQINGPFLKSLSVIDPLFNIGAQETARIIRDAWKIDHEE